MRQILHTNLYKRRLIRLLIKAARTNKAAIWRYVAELLAKPRRQSIRVNISKINRYTRDGEVVVVPGKVLGAGSLDHRVTVAAFAFSEKALAKIKESGGRVLTIEELLEENPRGSNVRIII